MLANTPVTWLKQLGNSQGLPKGAFLRGKPNGEGLDWKCAMMGYPQLYNLGRCWCWGEFFAKVFRSTSDVAEPMGKLKRSRYLPLNSAQVVHELHWLTGVFWDRNYTHLIETYMNWRVSIYNSGGIWEKLPDLFLSSSHLSSHIYTILLNHPQKNDLKTHEKVPVRTSQLPLLSGDDDVWEAALDVAIKQVGSRQDFHRWDGVKYYPPWN